MAISKYVFRLVGHGSDITEDSVTAILEDLKTVVKPYKDIVDIDINGNEATILLYSDSKIKKNQKMGTELTMAVVFKHLKNFSRMYKRINDVDCGFTIFHSPLEKRPTKPYVRPKSIKQEDYIPPRFTKQQAEAVR